MPNMKSSSEKPHLEVKPELEKCFKDLARNNPNVRLVGVCTVDGFNIKSYADRSLKTNSDKLAAISSSIAALGSSTAKHLDKKDFTITIIETENGNILFMRGQYLKQPCVTCLATTESSTLAQDRYDLKRFVTRMGKIS